MKAMILKSKKHFLHTFLSSIGSVNSRTLYKSVHFSGELSFRPSPAFLRVLEAEAGPADVPFKESTLS